MFYFQKISLRIRIFISMILLVFLASILILLVTIYQYDEQTHDYNLQRFERKESTAIQIIELELSNKTTYPISTENLYKIFKERIYEISSINKLNISMYDLHGNLLVSSKTNAFEKTTIEPLEYDLLIELAQNSNHRILKTREEDGTSYQTSFIYINDPKFKRIGIVEMQLTQDNSEVEYELREFISRLSLVYLLMFVIAISLAYFLSSYITKSIKSISDKMQQTRLNQRNEKILLDASSSEIEILVEAYNNMIDQLEESAAKLAKSEREQAWREMAKQVAHEIKNPLTPMRLTVQSFERRFDVTDPNIKEKLNKKESDALKKEITNEYMKGHKDIMRQHKFMFQNSLTSLMKKTVIEKKYWLLTIKASRACFRKTTENHPNMQSINLDHAFVPD